MGRRMENRMGIDYSRAREVFEQYLNGYDRKDGKVRLKITHTYGVVAQSTALAKRMRLGEEDTQLAWIIALLHDIGRFEQLRRFDSFLPETMDHAAYGVELLFGEGMIRDFLPEDTWDGIIRTAIAKHSDYRLEGVEDPRTLLHARLIRDADKLDNCRVKLEDPLETFAGGTAEEIGAQKISPKVKAEVMAGKSILSSDRVTLMDFWVSYLAYFYDLNFRESLDIVEERDYVRRIAGRIPCSDPETARSMEEIVGALTAYVHSHGKSK
ncbi:HD domain-containing protein [Faecalicatena fissicatena]|uniref:HD domain-containing protein n=2 Tax=Eubacteriales TaxID=186802 RepID=UPI002ED0E4D6